MRNLITVLLVVAVAITWYLAPPPQPGGPKKDAPVDYFLVDFDRMQMDTNGTISTFFHAQRADHYPGLEATKMIQPRAISYSEGRPPWFVRADHGVQFEKKDWVRLTGDVVANQRYPDSDKFTMVESEIMDLYTKKEYFKTDLAIKITTEDSVTTSVGAEGWMESGRLLLLSNAAGRYEPRRTPEPEPEL